MTDTIAAYRKNLVDELARLDAHEQQTRAILDAAAGVRMVETSAGSQPAAPMTSLELDGVKVWPRAEIPTGVYGRPGIRAVDGMRIDEVVCGSGDGDCMFPDCGCGRKWSGPPGPDLSNLPPLPAELATLLSKYREAVARVARVFPLMDEALTAEFETNNKLVTAIRMAIAKKT